MTLQEILAKLTGLETKFATAETEKATAAAALTAETEARKTLEGKLTAAEAKIATMAAAPPPTAPATDHTPAIEALEKAIAVLKASCPAPAGEPDTETKAEDSADMSDDEEAKKASASKDFTKVSAIRAGQFARKQAFVAKRTQAATDEKIKKGVVAQIASLGIAMPLPLNRDGDKPIRAEKPDGSKRAHRLVAGGFNEDPAVARLNAAFGRSVRN